tara:strand:+ start:1339 stop:1554 length:216 start_codon:yes stop_codon:yes gene_type:complete
MTKKYAIVENKKVHIGDMVGFKSDYEQYGTIVKINGVGKNAVLELHDPDGFGGDYLRYARYTDMEAKRCWL